jgi:hypothetical protein
MKKATFRHQEKKKEYIYGKRLVVGKQGANIEFTLPKRGTCHCIMDEKCNVL